MSVRWLKFLFSFGFLVVLLWVVDTENVWLRLKAADPLWVSVAVLATTAATFSMARRWQIVARSFDIRISYGRALREYYLAQLVNIVVPGGVVGDVARAARTRDAADLSRAAQSVIVERIVGQVYLLGAMFFGFLAVLLFPGALNWQSLNWLVPAVLTAGALALCALSRTETRTGRLIHTTLALIPRPTMLLHGAITTTCLVMGFYACARATGAAIPAVGWVTVIPLVLCAMLIPLSIGGWGWREGAAAALFPIIGAPASAGIATGITYGLVLLLAAVPAWLFLSAHTLSPPPSTKEKPDTP